MQRHADAHLLQVTPYIHEALVRAYIGNASHRGLRDDDLAVLAAPWLGEEGLKPAFYRQITAYDEHYLVENEGTPGPHGHPCNRVLWGGE